MKQETIFDKKKSGLLKGELML